MLRRRTSMGVGLLGAALAASVGAHGCVQDAVSLSVVCAGVPKEEDAVCRVDADVESCLAGGSWNLNDGRGYGISLVLRSGLAERQNDVPLRAETNALTVTEMVVTLRNAAGKKIKFTTWPNPFTVKVQGFVPPGGLGISSGVIVPNLYIKQLQEAFLAKENPLRQVIADIEIHAKTQGQEPVEVASWAWPIFLDIASLNFEDGQCTPPKADELICGDDAYFLCDCNKEHPCPEE